MPVSARMVERLISEMGADIKEIHTEALKDTTVFNVALDECGHQRHCMYGNCG